MGTIPPDPFDPLVLALPACDREGGRNVAPRHAPGETFLKGPIPWGWWASACRLPGRALQVASAVRYLAGREGCSAITLGLADLERSLRVLPDAAARGLRALAGAGLVVVQAGPGRKPIVTLIETADKSGRACRAVLRGPIPWSWWARACRLPGRGLQVGSALWALVGWDRGRSGPFLFGLADWPELGLSRFSAARGLAALETAGLVAVERSIGRKPLVRLQEARQGHL